MRPNPATPYQHARRREDGLTLLELLVVVAILAVLTTVAVRSTTDLGSEVRYDSTQATLKVFRDGVIGPPNQISPDGSPLVTGFIADMGRPPRSALTTHPTYGGIPDISELYTGTLPSGLKAYSLYGATNSTIVATNLLTAVTTSSFLFDSTLKVAAGWRGPYVSKLSSQVTLQDGWGKAMVSRTDLGTTPGQIDQWPTKLLTFRTVETYGLPEDPTYTAVTTIGKDITGWFTSSGFEGAPTGAGDPYSGHFYSMIAANEYQIPMTVNVTISSGLPFNPASATAASWLLLAVYGPNPNVASDSKPLSCTASQVLPNTGYSYTFNLTGANSPTIGTRVFRVMLHYVTSTTTTDTKRTVYFPVRAGTQNVNLSIP